MPIACSTPLIACPVHLSCHDSKRIHVVTQSGWHRLPSCQKVLKVTPAAVPNSTPAALCKGSAVDKRQALHSSASDVAVPAAAKIQGDAIVHLVLVAVISVAIHVMQCMQEPGISSIWFLLLSFQWQYMSCNVCRNMALSATLDVPLFYPTSTYTARRPRYQPPFTSPTRAVGSCC